MVGYSIPIFLLKMKNKIVWVHILISCVAHTSDTNIPCVLTGLGKIRGKKLLCTAFD